MDAETRKELNAILLRLQTIEGELAHSRAEDGKRDRQYNDMMTILVDIKARLDKQDGAKDMAKTLWSIFGAIIIATILGVSSLLWSHNAKIAQLETIAGG